MGRGIDMDANETVRRLTLLRKAQRKAASYGRAKAAGTASPPCDPRQILFTEAGLKRVPSRAWLVQWLAQQAIERMLLRPGPALLLLRVTAFIGERKGVAWIGGRTLRALSGRNKKTFERDRRALTAPWTIDGAWYPPLFRIVLVGRGLKRRVHWVPLEAGWTPFIALLDAGSRAEKEEARAPRGLAPGAGPPG